MSLFRRKCRECGQAPQLTVAPLIRGAAGTSEVEFTNFPYKACRCGRLVQWAFDPGLEFSEQLFADEGVPTAKGRKGDPICRACGAELGHPEPVTLTATAQLNGFAPISMTVRASGYRCASCGLAQAPPGEFEAGGMYSKVRPTDAGRALDAATESVGLSL